jgi:hypothetical protein
MAVSCRLQIISVCTVVNAWVHDLSLQQSAKTACRTALMSMIFRAKSVTILLGASGSGARIIKPYGVFVSHPLPERHFHIIQAVYRVVSPWRAVRSVRSHRPHSARLIHRLIRFSRAAALCCSRWSQYKLEVDERHTSIDRAPDLSESALPVERSAT